MRPHSWAAPPARGGAHGSAVYGQDLCDHTRRVRSKDPHVQNGPRGSGKEDTSADGTVLCVFLERNSPEQWYYHKALPQ